MKKLIMTMIFMLTLVTPTFADFTLADLFVSGGVQKPTVSSAESKKDHNA